MPISNPFPPVRPLPLNVSPASTTVPPAGYQVFKHGSPAERFSHPNPNSDQVNDPRQKNSATLSKERLKKLAWQFKRQGLLLIGLGSQKSLMDAKPQAYPPATAPSLQTHLTLSQEKCEQRPWTDPRLSCPLQAPQQALLHVLEMACQTLGLEHHQAWDLVIPGDTGAESRIDSGNDLDSCFLLSQAECLMQM